MICLQGISYRSSMFVTSINLVKQKYSHRKKNVFLKKKIHSDQLNCYIRSSRIQILNTEALAGKHLYV